jgi:hypothetical protein
MGSIVRAFLSPAVKTSTYDWLKSNDSSFAEHAGTPNFALIIARTTILFGASIGLIQHCFKMPFTIFSATCLAGGWIAWEYQWFIQAVRKAALAVYAEQRVVPSSTVTYLANDPEAVKTLISNGGDLQKTCVEELSAGEKSLLKTLIRRSHVSARTKEIWFEVFQLLARVPHALDADDLKFLVSSHSYSGCIVYTLEQGFVLPKDVTSQQQTQLWQLVRDFACMRTLSKKFPVQEAARVKLREWLAGMMGIESVGDLCHLLALGAQTPSLDEEFNYRSDVGANDPKQKTQTITTQRTLKSLKSIIPELIAVIEQAHQPGEDVAVPEEQAWIGSRRPLVNIVFSQRKFEIAKNVISSRLAIVLGVVSVVALRILPWKLALCVSGLTALGYYAFECQRAQKYLRETALNIFKRVFPAHSVVSFAAQDLSLVQQLTKEELVKFDDYGETLWDHFARLHRPNFEIFKLFADEMANKEPALKQKFFCYVVRSGHANFVQYLLENQKVKIEEISDQFWLWFYLNDASVARVLKTFGFNPEVNENGMTPLHYLLNNDQHPNVQRIRALLVAGAKFDVSKVPNFNQFPFYIKSLCLGTNYIEKVYQASF